MIFFVNILVLAGVMPVFWWLSGYDSRLTGQNQTDDLIRRGFRCGITLLLVEAAFLCLWNYWRYNDPANGFAFLASALPLAMIWAGCISQLLANGFSRLIDPEDKREFDPDKMKRQMDLIATLIRQGKRKEAIKLCQILKESGEFDDAALDLTLEHLGVHQEKIKLISPLAEAHRLKSQGKLVEARLIFESLLAKDPRNMEAAMALIRLYTEDLHQPDMAKVVLRQLERQPYMSASHLEFAKRLIDECNQPKINPLITDQTEPDQNTPKDSAS